MLAGSKWKELWDRTHTPDGTLIPKMLTGRFIDLPVDTAALMRLAALAPPEVKPKSIPRKRKGEEATVIRRAREYLAKIDPAISGQHGHDITYRAACTLVIDFDLSIDEARPLLAEFNERCQPPWTEAELDHKLESADKSPGERGLLLIEKERPKIDNHENTFEEFSSVPVKPNISEIVESIELPSVTDENLPDFLAEPVLQSQEIQHDEIQKPLGEPIRNFHEVMNDGKVIKVPLPINVITIRAMRETGNWPQRVNKSLFKPRKGNEGIDWIDSPAALFAYFGDVTGRPPEFQESNAYSHYHTRSEVFKHLEMNAKSHLAVESLPHIPPIEDHYYACEFPKFGSGEILNALVDRFNPDTNIDRDLIFAAFVTPFWGGHGGTRPVFCVTSEDGRGAGKSRVAFMVSAVAGGFVELSNNDDIGKFKTRLLSNDGATKRVVLLDNIKSLKFSWAELEALVTAPTISGHKMFTGEGQRPNTLTYMMTLNGVSLATDLAQRCVVIKIRKPVYNGNWEEETRKFIQENRRELIADILAFLSGPAITLSRYSRWGDWERDVLARLPEPTEAQKVIAERQIASDVESEESDLIEELFAKKIAELEYRIDEKVFIPSSIAAKWHGEAIGERHIGVTKSSRGLRQKIEEGQFRRLQDCANRNYGRGFEWWGVEYSGGEAAKTDIEVRIKNINRNSFE